MVPDLDAIDDYMTAVAVFTGLWVIATFLSWLAVEEMIFDA